MLLKWLKEFTEVQSLRSGFQKAEEEMTNLESLLNGHEPLPCHLRQVLNEKLRLATASRDFFAHQLHQRGKLTSVSA